MSEDTQVAEALEAEEQPTPEPQAPAEKTFSQEEVNKLIAREVRKAKQKQTTAKKDDGLQDQLAEVLQSLQTNIAHVAKRLDEQEAKAAAQTFDAAFAQSGIPDEFKELIWADVKVNQPKDIAQRLAEHKAKLVKDAPSDPEQKPAAAEPTSTPGTTPTVTKDFSGFVDITKLSREDVTRLQNEGRFVEVLERYRTHSNGPPPFRKKRIK